MSQFKKLFNKQRVRSKDIEARLFVIPSPLIVDQRKVPGETPYFGAHGDEETPVPIPNTEVKLISGDYTAQVGN